MHSYLNWPCQTGELVLIYLIEQNSKPRESPPVWTQEAYRLLCIEYSFCCPTWVPPLAVYSPPAGYPPARVPPVRVPPTRVPPHQGTPLCPMAFWEMLQSIMGYGYPPCGQTDSWKDRRMSKHYLPVVLRTRAVKIGKIVYNINCSSWFRYLVKA